MADPSSPIEFEDVPLEEARRMGRGPRMEPMLYDTLRQKIQALSSKATRIRLGPEITPQRMKNYILRHCQLNGTPLYSLHMTWHTRLMNAAPRVRSALSR